MIATLTSAGIVDVIPVSQLSVGDLVFTDRPSLEFTNLGEFDISCQFVRVANGDKNTPASQIQLTLDIFFEATVFLDFWNGADHASLGFSSWNNDWFNSDVIGTSFRDTNVNANFGPGLVYSKTVSRGELNLYGNDGDGVGTYYAFVCPIDASDETSGNFRIQFVA